MSKSLAIALAACIDARVSCLGVTPHFTGINTLKSMCVRVHVYRSCTWTRSQWR